MLENDKLTPESFENFLNKLKCDIDDPKIYRDFRKNILSIKKYTKNNNTVIDQNSEYFKKLIPFLDFIVNDNEKNIENDFLNTMKSFLHINNKRTLDKMNIFEKIELAYSLLDFNIHYKEKINQKNKPNNMHNDLKHFIHAHQSKYFVTEDKSTIKKAKLVVNALSLKVKILNIEEFVVKFS
ncbi:hypothetical protein [Campylobacter blaseri]|nr:hypothetical protein [Campylobacter blaseri]